MALIYLYTENKKFSFLFLNASGCFKTPRIHTSGYLKTFNFFYSIKLHEIKPDTILFGYIDALSKFCSIFTSYIYAKLFTRFIDIDSENIFRQKISFIILVFVVLFISYYIYKYQSLLATYILFLIGLTTTNAIVITLE
ncbi:hypothetical protein CDIK_4025, partial [Cucumispora dikerogammari]